MTPHPDYERILAEVRQHRLRATPVFGVLYRFVAPRWGGPINLLSGEGSFRHGSRWNWPGLTRAVYGSFDPQAAMAEVESHASRAGVILADHLPRQLEAFRAQLSEVFDLTDLNLQARLGLPRQPLDVKWELAIDENREAITHAVGRAAFTVGFEGILVPCAPKPEMLNLVVFREHCRVTSVIEYYGITR